MEKRIDEKRVLRWMRKEIRTKKKKKKTREIDA